MRYEKETGRQVKSKKAKGKSSRFEVQGSRFFGLSKIKSV
jgi:hypothetical protein